MHSILDHNGMRTGSESTLNRKTNAIAYKTQTHFCFLFILRISFSTAYIFSKVTYSTSIVNLGPFILFGWSQLLRNGGTFPPDSRAAVCLAVQCFHCFQCLIEYRKKSGGAELLDSCSATYLASIFAYSICTKLLSSGNVQSNHFFLNSSFLTKRCNVDLLDPQIAQAQTCSAM